MTDKRNLELQQLAAQRDRLAEDLRSCDWVERLAANSDFQRFVQTLREAQAKNRESLESIKQNLVTLALPADKAQTLREQGLIASGIIDGVEETLTLPKKMVEHLAEARRTLEQTEKKLEELKEQEALAHG